MGITCLIQAFIFSEKTLHLAQVSPGDLVITEKLRHVDVNDKINIQRVLMLGSRFETIIGRPLVPGAVVTAAIEVRDRLGLCSLLLMSAAQCSHTLWLGAHSLEA